MYYREGGEGGGWGVYYREGGEGEDGECIIVKGERGRVESILS